MHKSLFSLLTISLIAALLLPAIGAAQAHPPAPDPWQPPAASWQLLPAPLSPPAAPTGLHHPDETALFHTYDYLTFERGTSLRVYDINRDGWDDVLFITTSFNLRIWLQRPHCHGLVEWLSIPLEMTPKDLEVADLDGDGRPEIIVAGFPSEGQQYPGLIRIFYPTAKGDYSLMKTWETGPDLVKIQPADLNHDGRLDLWASSFFAVNLLTQQPDGSFVSATLPSPEPEGVYLNFVAAGDFNGDGRTDAVVQGNWLTVYYQSPDGALLPPKALPRWDEHTTTMSLIAVDADADGKMDLVASTGTSFILLYRQTPAGFAAPEMVQTYFNPTSPNVADMNGDGIDDLVYMNNGYGMFTVHYIFPSSSSLQAYATFPLGDAQSLGKLTAIGDLTGDGSPDVALLSTNYGLQIATEDETPACVDPVPAPAPAPAFLYAGIDPAQTGRYIHHHIFFTGDTEGTGRQTLWMAQQYNIDIKGFTQIYRVDLSDEGAVQLVPQLLINGPYLGSFSVGDLNGDGLADIAAIECPDCWKHYPHNEGRAVVLWRQPDGTYTQPQAVDGTLTAGAARIVDWTGDGVNDLMVITEAGTLIFEQRPGGLTQTHQYSEDEPAIGPNTLFLDFRLADWNGDGRFDIITFGRYCTFRNCFRVYVQTAPGEFKLAAERSVSATSEWTLGDVNDDGRVDLMIGDTGNSAETKILVLYQQKDGSLAPNFNYGDGHMAYPGALLVADLNFDGLNDLMSLCDALHILTQNQAHRLDPPRYYPVGGDSNIMPFRSVATLDHDQDGVPDLIAYSKADEYLLFLKPVQLKTVFLPVINK